MNVTSRAPYMASQPRIGTSPHLIASWSEEGVAWDLTRLDEAEKAAWWAWLLAELGVATVIVVGDVSLLMLFFTRKLLGQSTNILVFSIAVADLTTGLVVLPLDVIQRVLSETSGYTCKSYFYFSNVSKTAVIYTVTMLALERIVAALSPSFRILSPGRCLFFSSLTWFFAAAYNIWSVVLYDVRQVDLMQPYVPTVGELGVPVGADFLNPGGWANERVPAAKTDSLRGGGAGGGMKEGVSGLGSVAWDVNLRSAGQGSNSGGVGGLLEAMGASLSSSSSSLDSSSLSSPSSPSHNSSTHVCFSSTRFQRLVDIFVVVDFLVTFLLPALASLLLFGLFWRRRQATRAPGRPYRSSTSVIIFTFALLVSFLLCHLPLELVALHVHRRGAVRRDYVTDYDDVTEREWTAAASSRDSGEFLLYKVCQLLSFTRGFWDVFIFGVFRHYVCRKERALASFRDQYGSDRGVAAGLATGMVGPGVGRGGPGGLLLRTGGSGGEGEGVGAVRRTASLAVPVLGPVPSTSLLDSDQEVTITPHRSSASDH